MHAGHCIRQPCSDADTTELDQPDRRRGRVGLDCPVAGQAVRERGMVLAGQSHQPFSFGGIAGGRCGRTDQTHLPGRISAGRLHHGRDRRHRLWCELERATKGDCEVPRMGRCVDGGEQDHHGAGQLPEGRDKGPFHHASRRPHPRHPCDDVIGNRHQIPLAGYRRHGVLHRHEVLVGDQAGPEQLVVQCVAGQLPDRPRRAVGDGAHLGVVDRRHHTVQLVHRIHQRLQLIHHLLPSVLGERYSPGRRADGDAAMAR